MFLFFFNFEDKIDNCPTYEGFTGKTESFHVPADVSTSNDPSDGLIFCSYKSIFKGRYRKLLMNIIFYVYIKYTPNNFYNLLILDGW